MRRVFILSVVEFRLENKLYNPFFIFGGGGEKMQLSRESNIARAHVLQNALLNEFRGQECGFFSFFFLRHTQYSMNVPPGHGWRKEQSLF